MNDTQEIINLIASMSLQYGSRILGGIIVFVIGWVVANMVEKAIRQAMNRKGIDATAKSLLLSALSIILKMVVFLMAATTMGVETTSFVALLGSFGLAAGLALQGSLTNLAGGFLLLIFRPIRVGDYIKVQTFEGYVIEIQLLETILETSDKARIYLPNGSLANGAIINLSQHDVTRLRLPVQVAPEANIGQVRQLLVEMLMQHHSVKHPPLPTVVVTELSPDYIQLEVRPWCDPAVIAPVRCELLEAIKNILDQHDIPMPISNMMIKMAE